MVFTFIKMEPDMKESGKMTCNMDKAKKFGQIIQCMRVTITRARNMEKDFTFGKMGLAMMAIGTKIE